MPRQQKKIHARILTALSAYPDCTLSQLARHFNPGLTPARISRELTTLGALGRVTTTKVWTLDELTLLYRRAE